MAVSDKVPVKVGMAIAMAIVNGKIVIPDAIAMVKNFDLEFVMSKLTKAMLKLDKIMHIADEMPVKIGSVAMGIRLDGKMVSSKDGEHKSLVADVDGKIADSIKLPMVVGDTIAIAILGKSIDLPMTIAKVKIAILIFGDNKLGENKFGVDKLKLNMFDEAVKIGVLAMVAAPSVSPSPLVGHSSACKCRTRLNYALLFVDDMSRFQRGSLAYIGSFSPCRT